MNYSKEESALKAMSTPTFLQWLIVGDFSRVVHCFGQQD